MTNVSGDTQVSVTKESANIYAAVMEILDVTLEDAGKYRVVARNELGELTANLTLNMEGEHGDKGGEAPVFVEKPKISSEKAGKVIIMECKVKSKAAPDITWYCEGKVIIESSRIKQTITGEADDIYVVRLELNNLEVEDAGLYKCNVKNATGEANANLTLNIECKLVMVDG